MMFTIPAPVALGTVSPRTGKPKDGERIPATGCCGECGNNVSVTVLRSPVDGDIDPRMERGIRHHVDCSFFADRSHAAVPAVRMLTPLAALAERGGDLFLAGQQIRVEAGDSQTEIAERINQSLLPVSVGVADDGILRLVGRRAQIVPMPIIIHPRPTVAAGEHTIALRPLGACPRPRSRPDPARKAKRKAQRQARRKGRR